MSKGAALAKVASVAGSSAKSAKAVAPSYGSDLTPVFLVGTIVVVGLGTVITKKQVNMKAILAGGVVALGLSALDNINERMAEAFAAMIFIAACVKFLPDVVRELGYENGGSGNNIKAVPPAHPMTDLPPKSGGSTQGASGGVASPQNSTGTREA
ncbi:hypothetical protein Toil_gp24 [Rhodococcus phage Toil]|uniref:Uncharacterized protein n=1 Tax=Rhodococcus phage Toil TaxID=1975614 RepID=A0A1W6DXI0_9VIRU|nr:hypothetical protein KMD62_gp24 [Rhodococcus phage Toil]ARK07707.1 hypothetical protein Toil_gp24 [Rhodococcus phage Toil]